MSARPADDRQGYKAVLCSEDYAINVALSHRRRTAGLLRALCVRFAGDDARIATMTAVSHAALAAEIARVAKLGNLTAAHLAQATGGDPSSARRWLRGTRAPSGAHAVRALELTSLVERLAQVMEATYIPIWLIKPIERLDDRRPIDVIRSGDYRSVSRLVATLEDMPVS